MKKRKMKVLRYGIYACAALLFASCAASKADVKEQQTLLSSAWKIVKVNGEAAAGEDVPSMTLDAKGVSGSTGCNRYFGSYILSGNKLKFDKVGSTQRLCANAPAEGAILEALGKVVSFKAESTAVYLYDATGTCVLELGK